MHRMIIAQDELAHIKDQAAAQYPSVCCGVVLTRSGNPEDRVTIACQNAQDDAHRENPEFYPLTSRDGYYISPLDLLTICKYELEGYFVSAIYYSRVDKDASFSDTSKRTAVADGEAMYPRAVYLPVSVLRGSVAEVGAFKWDATSREFVATFLA